MLAGAGAEWMGDWDSSQARRPEGQALHKPRRWDIQNPGWSESWQQTICWAAQRSILTTRLKMEVWKRKNKAGNIRKQGSGSLAIVSPEAYPIPSLYGIFNYIWLILMVNVGKYTIHAWYGYKNLESMFSCRTPNVLCIVAANTRR